MVKSSEQRMASGEGWMLTGKGAGQVVLLRLLAGGMGLLLLVLAVWEWAPHWLPLPLVRAQQTVDRPLPEFPERPAEEWFNSTPLKKKDLLGKVVFLDVWTFG